MTFPAPARPTAWLPSGLTALRPGLTLRLLDCDKDQLDMMIIQIMNVARLSPCYSPARPESRGRGNAGAQELSLRRCESPRHRWPQAPGPGDT